jgi:hypothetical protein
MLFSAGEDARTTAGREAGATGRGTETCILLGPGCATLSHPRSPALSSARACVSKL